MDHDEKDKMEKSLHHMQEEHSEVYKAYENYGQLLQKMKGTLDDETSALIKVSLSAANNTPHALKTNIYNALDIGCGVKDIEHAVFLSATTAGFPTMMEGYMVFRDVVDDNAPSKNVVLDNIISH